MRTTGRETLFPRRGCRQRRLGLLALLAALLGMAIVPAADPVSPAGWKFDVIRLKNGSVFRGLIVGETPAAIHFRNVRQHPGRPTVLFDTTFALSEIADVERLPPAERERVQARVRELDPSGQAEKQRMERLGLETIAWAGQPGVGRRYTSDYFVLESDAPEGVVRRAAVRLEQIYAAYARYLPPRATGQGPTTITLFQSRAEYQARLAAEKRQFVNLAFYDPSANRILCASDLRQLGEDLERVRQQHQQMRLDLDRQEAALGKLYRGKELARMLQTVRSTRQRLDAADRQNEAIFDQAVRQLFTVLYHEAFHAYLARFVYPPPGPEPPRWLNEGLAQVFETAFVEAGELRVGHADRDRLARVKEAVRKGDLVPLERLLRSGPRDFLAAHAGDRVTTGQFYLTAWGLAFHLAFERRLLGTPELDGYFKALACGADPVAAFTDLVGSPLPEFERGFQRYLLQLQPDGTTAGEP